MLARLLKIYAPNMTRFHSHGGQSLNMIREGNPCIYNILSVKEFVRKPPETLVVYVSMFVCHPGRVPPGLSHHPILPSLAACNGGIFLCITHPYRAASCCTTQQHASVFHPPRCATTLLPRYWGQVGVVGRGGRGRGKVGGVPFGYLYSYS